MNHAQARAPTQHASALQAVLQFLLENGYVTSAETLQEESETQYDENALENSPAHLLTALTSYEDQRTGAFKKKADDPELLVITQWMHTLRESREPFAQHALRALQSHMANVICCKFQPKDGSNLYAAGSADKSVAICDVETNVVLRRLQASGPVLSMHFNPVRPELLLATCMNGGHSVLNVERDADASASAAAASGSSSSPAVLHSAVDHKKFVVTGKWSPDGKLYATGSHDFFINVYAADGESAWKQVGRIELGAQVEALEWVDSSSFLASLREDNYLHHIRVSSNGGEDGQVKLTEEARLNVNETGDDHVSFNVLDMALSPNGLAVLLATDKHRCILLARGSGSASSGGVAVGRPGQVRNFYNVQNDGYSTPRLAWSPSGRFAYVTCQDKTVAVLDIAAGRTVHRIQGHLINVRDVAVQKHTGNLLTCSFDKTCRVWSTEEKQLSTNVGNAAPMGASASASS